MPSSSRLTMRKRRRSPSAGISSGKQYRNTNELRGDEGPSQNNVDQAPDIAESSHGSPLTPNTPRYSTSIRRCAQSPREYGRHCGDWQSDHHRRKDDGHNSVIAWPPNQTVGNLGLGWIHTEPCNRIDHHDSAPSPIWSRVRHLVAHRPPRALAHDRSLGPSPLLQRHPVPTHIERASGTPAVRSHSTDRVSVRIKHFYFCIKCFASHRPCAEPGRDHAKVRGGRKA